MSKEDKLLHNRVCNDVTHSLGEIVRFSMNEDFRNNCFEALNVDCTKNLEEKINVNLKNHCVSNQISVPTPSKNNKQQIIINEEVSPKLVADMSTPTKSTHILEKKNWLKVAAQQTKNIISKRESSTFLLRDMKNSPISLRMSQPTTSIFRGKKEKVFASIGHVSLSQLIKSPLIAEKPSYRFSPYYRHDAKINAEQPNSPLSVQKSRIVEVPERTRKALFLDQETPINYFN